MRETIYRSNDPLSLALEVVGDKWTLLIIRDIIMKGKNTYNEFLASEEKIATNVLATRLSKLEEAGIIRSGRHPDSKAKIFYTLTEKGVDLLPAIAELMLWAELYLPVSAESKVYLKELRKNKEKFITQVQTQLRKKAARNQ
jgi:DNA-binding HxlR family transcriptional regulator